jgi:hypothetical protein
MSASALTGSQIFSNRIFGMIMSNLLSLGIAVHAVATAGYSSVGGSEKIFFPLTFSRDG